MVDVFFTPYNKKEMLVLDVFLTIKFPIVSISLIQQIIYKLNIDYVMYAMVLYVTIRQTRNKQANLEQKH